MFTRVLLTTDGSPSSLAAIPYAAELVDSVGEVHVLEVIEALPQDVARELGLPAGQQGLERLDLAVYESAWWYRRAMQHVERVRDVLQRRGVRSIVTAVRAGRPVDAIVEYARTEGCQAVVMATQGRSGLRRVVLGSVAQAVLGRLEDMPVVLVRPSAASAEHAAADAEEAADGGPRTAGG